MTKHIMHLHPHSFDLVMTGLKTIELRLNDEKRKQIQVHDHIEFKKLPDAHENVICKVIELQSFASLEDLSRNILLGTIGCAPEMTIDELTKSMTKYYVQDEIVKFGWLAIGIELIEA